MSKPTCSAEHGRFCQTRKKRNADGGKGGIKQHQVRGDGHSEHVSDNASISTVPSHWKKINLTFLGQRKLKTNGGRWLPRSKQRAKALHHLFIPSFLSKRKGQAIFCFFFLPHRRRPDGFMCSGVDIHCLPRLQIQLGSSSAGNKAEHESVRRKGKNKHPSLPLAPLHFPNCLPQAALFVVGKSQAHWC